MKIRCRCRCHCGRWLLEPRLLQPELERGVTVAQVTVEVEGRDPEAVRLEFAQVGQNVLALLGVDLLVDGEPHVGGRLRLLIGQRGGRVAALDEVAARFVLDLIII